MRRTNIPTLRRQSYIPTFDEADLEDTLLADWQLGDIDIALVDDYITNQNTTTKRFSPAVWKGDVVTNDADLGEKDSVTLIMYDWDNSGTSIPGNNVTNASTTMEAVVAQSVHETLRYNINAIRNNVLSAGKYLLEVNLDTDSNSNNSHSFATGELDAMTITVDDDDDETVLDDDDDDEDGDFDEDRYSEEESIIGGDEVESMEHEVNLNENKRRLLRYLDLEPKHDFDVTYSEVVKNGPKSPKHAKQHHQYEKGQDKLGVKMVKIIIEAEPKAINGKNSNLTDMRSQQKANSLILGCDNTASNKARQNDYNEAYEPVDKEICILF